MNVLNLNPATVFVSLRQQKPNFNLAGGRTQSQVFWIDGASGQNKRLGVCQVDLDPPVQTVQEIRILSNNYSVEYGAPGDRGGWRWLVFKRSGGRSPWRSDQRSNRSVAHKEKPLLVP